MSGIDEMLGETFTAVIALAVGSAKVAALMNQGRHLVEDMGSLPEGTGPEVAAACDAAIALLEALSSVNDVISAQFDVKLQQIREGMVG